MYIYVCKTLFNYYAILQYFLVFIMKNRCMYMYVCVCFIYVYVLVRGYGMYSCVCMSIYTFVWFVCNSICM